MSAILVFKSNKMPALHLIEKFNKQAQKVISLKDENRN